MVVILKGRSFAAQVNAWCRKSEKRMDAVFKQSTQDLFEIAQTPGPNAQNPGAGEGGNMPVVSGFLRNSLRMSLNGSSAMTTGADSYLFTIARAKAGDTITGEWTAVYASAVHFGGAGGGGYLWVPRASVQWPAIVRKNIAIAQAIN